MGSGGSRSLPCWPHLVPSHLSPTPDSYVPPLVILFPSSDMTAADKALSLSVCCSPAVCQGPSEPRAAAAACVPPDPPPAPTLTHLHVLGCEARERLQREVRLVPLLPLHVLVVVREALALQPQVANEFLHLPERNVVVSPVRLPAGWVLGACTSGCVSTPLSCVFRTVFARTSVQDPLCPFP